jgi:hypothetical protein
MRMKIMNVLHAMLRGAEAFFEVQFPLDAPFGLRTR